MITDLRQHWPWYAGGLAFLLVTWLLAPILSPFIFGAGIAYLGDPLVDRLQRWKLSRTAAVSLVFTVLTLLLALGLLLLIPALHRQGVALVKGLPEWLAWFQNTALPRLGLRLPEGLSLDAEGLRAVIAEHWAEAGGVAQVVWSKVSGSGAALATAFANLLLVPIVSFYLLRDWDSLVAWVRDMVPPRNRARVERVARETDEVLGSFLRGQLSVMAALAALYSTGLALAGLDLALIIGVTAGFLSFVPYLGFAVGFVAALIAMLVQTHELLPLVWVALVFGVGQVLESAWLTPNLVGDRIGLHPVAVIFAVMAGGQLFGFMGVLLALPVSAVLAVQLRHAKTEWLRSPLYLQGAPPVEAPPGAPDPLP